MMGFFIFATSSRPVLRSTQPPMKWIPEFVSPGVKQPEREDDHSPPSTAEVKMFHSHSTS
jgi:hypothetical protein